jgi:queuine/archaeosine tRNA-ribosyltransferase
MEDMRRSIMENSFQSFKNNFMDGYKPTHEATRLSQKETWMEARNIRGG